MKTASRILGSAAFHSGFLVQDSPVYGAERRGAPVAAFTRISRQPILERGAIERPDLVVIADETLLREPSAQPISGCDRHTTVLINSAREEKTLRERTGHPGPILSADFAAMALEMTRSLAGLSSALGTAAASLVGLGLEHCLAGLKEELEDAHLTAAQREANTALAHAVYRRVSSWPAVRERAAMAGRVAQPLVDVAFEPAWRAAPTVYAVANTPERRTGSWRQFRPVLEEEKCSRCWACFVWCPDAAIGLDEKSYPVVDYTVCKGCLLCAHECPTHAFRVEKELR